MESLSYFQKEAIFALLSHSRLVKHPNQFIRLEKDNIINNIDNKKMEEEGYSNTLTNLFDWEKIILLITLTVRKWKRKDINRLTDIYSCK